MGFIFCYHATNLIKVLESKPAQQNKQTIMNNSSGNNIPKPIGLVNLGNTCYFNSIMQVLLNEPLLGILLEERNSSTDTTYTMYDPTSEEDIELKIPTCDFAVKSLVDLYKTYSVSQQSTTSSQPIAPSKLISCIRQKTNRFQRLVQEDSHELLRSLIDIVRSDEIRRQRTAISTYSGNKLCSTKKANCFTIIDMIFGGYFLSSVQCQKCKFKSQHLEPFYDLSLAITDPINDIRGAISNFTSNAILDGDNKFICERCSKEHGKKTFEAGIKSTAIAVPPNILTLHLKRFEASTGGGERGGVSFSGGRRGKRNGGGGRARRKGNKNRGDDDDDEDFVSVRGGGSFRKINKHVEFTEFLDLSDFISDLCYDLTKINKWPRIDRGDPIWYSLYGVVCHSGSLRGGHYTCYVRCDDIISLEKFAEFIQETPYLTELVDIDAIKNHIREHDMSQYDNDGSSVRISNCYDEKPDSLPDTWYHISDSCVKKSTLTSVLSSQAYIVFYRRLIKIEE